MARVRRARVLTVASRKRLILRCMAIGGSSAMPAGFLLGVLAGIAVMKVAGC